MKYSRGLNTWKVVSKDGNIYSNWDEVKEEHQSQIRPNHFPQHDEVNSINIQRCLRILPHQQDTGGFFVCVLTKKALCNWESKNNIKTETQKNNFDENLESTNDTEKKKDFEPPQKKQRRHQGFKEDPYIYFNMDEPLYKEISQYYGLTVCFAFNLLFCIDFTKKKFVNKKSNINL